MRRYKYGIDPATRGGTYSLDDALRCALFEDAVGFMKSSYGNIWKIVYDDGRVSRAVITGCYGFELESLGLERKFNASQYT